MSCLENQCQPPFLDLRTVPSRVRRPRRASNAKVWGSRRRRGPARPWNDNLPTRRKCSHIGESVAHRCPGGEKPMLRSRSISSIHLLILAAIAGPVALAQQAASESGVGALQEVVVTAQKREEKLHDVPMGVSAVGSDDINKQQLVDFADLRGQGAGPLGTAERARPRAPHHPRRERRQRGIDRHDVHRRDPVRLEQRARQRLDARRRLRHLGSAAHRSAARAAGNPVRRRQRRRTPQVRHQPPRSDASSPPPAARGRNIAHGENAARSRAWSTCPSPSAPHSA